MALPRLSLSLSLAVAVLSLTGCYETSGPVLTRGEEVPITPGVYRCLNDRDREPSTATISAPAQLAPGDVVYLATLDKDRYAVRAAAMKGDLFMLEARGNDVRGAGHVYVRRLNADRFELLVAESKAQTRLAALARTHNIAIEFPTYGAPRIDGPADRERAFLLAHTSAELQRTATCQRLP